MIIANPIYDVVFKKLMENERVAKFFISTLLGQEVESVEVQPQEFTYDDRLIGLRIFRLDFIALIKTEEGSFKKVLIEVQKAKKRIDLMRFRRYLAEQYKKEDKVEGVKRILPITTIYILGFKLPEIKRACIHVERQYKDLVANEIVKERDEFIENLTHDSYVVQVERITNRYKSRLDKLLSLFEQTNFIGDEEVVKEYKYEAEETEIRLMRDILHHAGTDPETREAIEKEVEAWRSVNAMFSETEREFKEKIEQQNKALAEQKEEIEQKDRALEEQAKLIEELKEKLKDD